VDVTCLNCSAQVTVGRSVYREISQFDREATEFNPAAHIIMESGISGSFLLHRCLIDVIPNSAT
jgi:hypothetical protein